MTTPIPELVCRVAETIAKYRMLEPSDRILVGVSGGADSVSLALILKELGYTLGIGHLNHSLRGADSDMDEHFVGELASKLAIPFFAHRAPIQASAGNLEAAGRAARQKFFRTTCTNHGFTKIALAHTRDDRVETLLLNLVRGAGIEGMVAMKPTAGSTIRPLIESNHKQIQEFLFSIDQAWRTDATNLDTIFARNRMRHDVIPSLAEAFNPRLLETLSRTIELLQGEEGWMRELTASWLAENSIRAYGNSAEIKLDASALLKAPVALARRAIRTAVRNAGSDMHDVTFERIESVRGLLGAGKSGKTIQLQGGMCAERTFDRLIFRRTSDLASEFSYDLPIPGIVHIPELGKIFRAGIADDTVAPQGSENKDWVFVNSGSLGPCVKIRNWKPGDFYKPVGWPSGKLKKLFQRARVPRSQRSRWPVIVNNNTVVWVASFPVSREFAPSERSQKTVVIEAIEAVGAMSD